jgi:hypothetical protein
MKSSLSVRNPYIYAIALLGKYPRGSSDNIIR